MSCSREYTVASWLPCWYDLYARPNIRQTTAERYRLIMDTYTIPCIGVIKLMKLTSHDLQWYRREESRAAARHCVLHAGGLAQHTPKYTAREDAACGGAIHPHP